MANQPTYLLVHGAWHGAWCWDALVAALARRGAAAATVELPSCGRDPATLGKLADDAAAVERALARIDGPVVVVGHSYGGVVITQARLDARVQRLMYLCAFMPEPGMSLVAHFPALPPYVSVRADGVVELVPSLVRDTFYHDCDPTTAEAAAARLVLHSAAAVTTPVDRASWRELPSSYLVCTEDRAIPVQVQRMFAARAATRSDLGASHSPMLSRPDQVAEVLLGG